MVTIMDRNRSDVIYVCIGTIWFNNIYLSPSNIYLAYTDTVEHHIGSLINGSSIVSTGIDLNEGITVTTEEQIKLQEIYFDE